MTPTKDTALIYKDFPEHSDEKISTRVFALFPGLPGDPIRCRLGAVILGEVADVLAYERSHTTRGSDGHNINSLQCECLSIIEYMGGFLRFVE